MLYQGSSTWLCLGFIRPQNMPPYWNENEAPYALVSSMNQQLEFFHLSDANPYRNEADPYTEEERIKSTLRTSTTPSARNPFTNDVDILAGLQFTPTSNRGIFGLSSPDIGFATDATLAIGDSIVAGDQTYCVIAPPTGTVPKLVVRVA
jgi:hypothetical protein